MVGERAPLRGGRGVRGGREASSSGVERDRAVRVVASLSTVGGSGASDPSGEWEIRWNRDPSASPPPIWPGQLSFWRDGDTWRVRLRFPLATHAEHLIAAESVRIEGERIDAKFRLLDGSALDLGGWIREGRFVGEIRTCGISWTPANGHRIGPIFR